jgi:serine/threonine-protein kinase
MPRHDAPRDLLFGLFALQNALISRDQLVMAFALWTASDGRSLAAVLTDEGMLAEPHRALVDALLEAHLKIHGDTEKSLAALELNHSTLESLAAAGGPEVEATLAHVGSGSCGDVERTRSHAVGSANGNGQRFRVLRPHARGGLGAVFVALDSELNREVALKQILERHADDAISRQRFLLEARITGGLEHPGIVPVYGLGHDCHGRPYYAMRFVHGDCLKEAIERFHADTALKTDPGRRSLELRQLLRRLVDACNAVGYAHSRGVLHRDLKPANIIVGKYGETLVIDWGLAKPVGRAESGPDAAERTLVPRQAGGIAETLPGSALGTPSYTSPEQAAGHIHRLGPRSDVYSLGATLYCLLTGKPPFEGDEPGEVLRSVQAGAFPHPQAVDPSLDRALEAICLKAMASRPEDRYGSPRALADDIERWMADEPVTARREPPAGRALRWVRRHRTSATAGAAAVLVALAGLAAVLAVQARANASLRAANAREQARCDLAMGAVRTLHTGVSEDLLLRQQGFDELRTQQLLAVRAYYHKLEGLLEGHADRPSRAALGRAYHELGGLAEQIGSQDEALAAYRRALVTRRALAWEPGADAESMAVVGRTLLALAQVLNRTGHPDEAMSSCEEARSLLESLTRSALPAAQLQADLALCQGRIGDVHLANGRKTEALAAYGRARMILTPLAEADPGVTRFRADLAGVHDSIGRLLIVTGRPDEALAALERARSLRAALAEAEPAVTRYQADLAASLISIGQLLGWTGRPDEALAPLEQARAVLEALTAAKPAVVSYRASLASVHRYLGDALHDKGRRSGRPTEALAAYQRWNELQEAVVEADPAAVTHQATLALSYRVLGVVLRQGGRLGEARAAFQKALAIQAGVVKAVPSAPPYQSDLAGAHLQVAGSLLATGEVDGADGHIRRAEAILGNLERCDSYAHHRIAVAASLRYALISRGQGRATDRGGGTGTGFADRAVGALRRSVESASPLDLRRVSHLLAEDPDLDPIRSRPDFQLLLRDVALPFHP